MPAASFLMSLKAATGAQEWACPCIVIVLVTAASWDLPPLCTLSLCCHTNAWQEGSRNSCRAGTFWAGALQLWPCL